MLCSIGVTDVYTSTRSVAMQFTCPCIVCSIYIHLRSPSTKLKLVQLSNMHNIFTYTQVFPTCATCVRIYFRVQIESKQVWTYMYIHKRLYERLLLVHAKTSEIYYMYNIIGTCIMLHLQHMHATHVVSYMYVITSLEENIYVHVYIVMEHTANF